MENIIEYYNEFLDDNDLLDYTEKEKRLKFFIENILELVTYDDNIGIKWGEIILETLEAINNRKTFDYIRESDENYFNYVQSCNLIKEWLDWGASIRGTWFNTSDGEIEYFKYGYDSGEVKIKITKEFMDDFIKFLKGE